MAKSTVAPIRPTVRVLEVARRRLLRYDGPDVPEDFYEAVYVLAYDIRRTAEKREEQRRGRRT